MNRKQRKKDAREQSTRQLMGIDDFTDYGIATRILCRPKDTGSCDYTSQKVERGTGSAREE